MSKFLTKLLVIFLIVGIVLVGISLYFSKGKVGLKRNKGSWEYLYETNTIKSEEILLPDDIINLNMDLNTVDVKFVTGDENKIVVKTENDYSYNFDEASKTFEIASAPTTNGFLENITIGIHGFNSNYNNSITVYLKDSSIIENLFVKIAFGNAYINDLTVKKLDIDNKYSDISIININADDFTVLSNSGSIHLENLENKTFEIESKFTDCDFSNINSKNSILLNSNSGSLDFKNITTDSLSISSKFSDYNFSNANINTLKLDSNSGEFVFLGDIAKKADVSSKFTDVSFLLNKKRDNYSININQKFADVNIDDTNIESNYNDLLNGAISFDITLNSGSLNINFNK